MAQDHSVFSNIQDNRTSSLAEQVADQINQVIIDQNINAGDNANPLLYLGIGALALITGVGVGLRGRKKKNKQ